MPVPFEDRDQRLKAAKIIVNVMAQMHPQAKRFC